jgi:hypothetical protein
MRAAELVSLGWQGTLERLLVVTAQWSVSALMNEDFGLHLEPFSRHGGRSNSASPAAASRHAPRTVPSHVSVPRCVRASEGLVLSTYGHAWPRPHRVTTLEPGLGRGLACAAPRQQVSPLGRRRAWARPCLPLHLQGQRPVGCVVTEQQPNPALQRTRRASRKPQVIVSAWPRSSVSSRSAPCR